MVVVVLATRTGPATKAFVFVVKFLRLLCVGNLEVKNRLMIEIKLKLEVQFAKKLKTTKACSATLSLRILFS